MSNPLLQKWRTSFGTPPFHLIDIDHFKPAIEEAIIMAAQEIAAITDNKESPSFNNTIAALDRAGIKLDDITSVLFNLNNAETNEKLQAAVQEVTPLVTRFSNDITLNGKLFSRVKKVYDSKEHEELSTEQIMLLDKSYRDFILGGAGLDEEKRSRFREISEELSRFNYGNVD